MDLYYILDLLDLVDLGRDPLESSIDLLYILYNIYLPLGTYSQLV